MMKKPRVGIIGMGRMGQRHLQACKSNEYELAGIWDIDQAKTAQVAREQELGPHVLYGGIEDFFTKSCMDMVVIATNADTHAAYILEAARHGIGMILSEKPLCRSFTELEQVQKTVEKSSIRLAVNHPHRFNPVYRQIDKLLRQGLIGRPASFHFVCGNVGVAMNGSHFLDVFMFLTDAKIKDVSADIYPDPLDNPRGPAYQDECGFIRARTHSDGPQFFMQAGHRQGHGIHLTIAGEHGLLWADVLSGEIRVNSRDEGHREKPSSQYALPEQVTLYSSGKPDIVSMSACMQKALWEAGNYPGLTEASDILKAIIAADCSSQQKGVCIGLDEIPDHFLKKTYRWA